MLASMKIYETGFFTHAHTHCKILWAHDMGQVHPDRNAYSAVLGPQADHKVPQGVQRRCIPSKDGHGRLECRHRALPRGLRGRLGLGLQGLQGWKALALAPSVPSAPALSARDLICPGGTTKSHQQKTPRQRKDRQS